MDFVDYLAPVGPSLLFRSPVVVAWIIGVVLAARMLRRGGGRAERLLLLGCCLMLAQVLISPFSSVLVTWLHVEWNLPIQRVAFIVSITQIPLAIISLGRVSSAWSMLSGFALGATGSRIKTRYVNR